MFWTWPVSKGKTEQFNFFNCLSNLKNLVLQMATKLCEMWYKCVKIGILFQKLQTITQRLGLCPSPPLCDTFKLHYFAHHVSQFRHFENFLALGSSPPPLAKFWLRSYPGPGFWSSILQDLCVIKNPFFRKFLMTCLHMICGLDCPQLKILATPYKPIYNKAN